MTADSHRSRTRVWWFVAILLPPAIGYCTFRPVCVPIMTEALAQFDPPIETRQDRDFYVRVFQEREGRWHQCKTWISRKLFF